MTRNKYAKKTCYMCDQSATSKEHIPPQCFFPTMEEATSDKGRLPEKDYRYQLITVPSCDTHNSHKSGDDEYLRAILVSHIRNDPKLQAIITKVILRSFEDDPTKRDWFTKEFRPIMYNQEPAIAVTIDFNRIKGELDKIAKAIYFLEHKFRTKWMTDFEIYSPGLLPGYGEMTKAGGLYKSGIDLMNYMSDFLLRDQPQKGSVPEIFHYKTHWDETENFAVVRMTFYGGLDVMAVSGPEDLDRFVRNNPGVSL